MRATITTTIETPQCVKELAGSLGVSVHFVYQMRANGFRMRWDSEARCECATPNQARVWLAQTRFTIRSGRGVIKR